jgi:hypothetical protein
VSALETQREREREGGKEGGRERDSLNMRVFVFTFVYAYVRAWRVVIDVHAGVFMSSHVLVVIRAHTVCVSTCFATFAILHVFATAFGFGQGIYAYLSKWQRVLIPIPSCSVPFLPRESLCCGESF